MVRIFPLIFILLWSSAFITTKPIIDNSDPFAALAFRFFFVAIGFYLFCVYSNLSIWQKVQVARHPHRPHFSDYIDNIFSDYNNFGAGSLWIGAIFFSFQI